MRLEAITKATAAAAKEAGVGFVDLFTPSQKLPAAAKQRKRCAGHHWRRSTKDVKGVGL